MARKKEKIDKTLLKELLISGSSGAAAGQGVNLTNQYIKENRALKSLEKIPNNKRIDAFMNKLKKGDIILEGHTKKISGSPIIDEKILQKINSQKSLKRLNLAKILGSVKESHAIRIASGGAPLHHASIYIGDGKIAHTPGGMTEIANLSDVYDGKRMVSIRITEDAKLQNKIASAAKSFGKTQNPYRNFGELIKQALKRNIIPLKSSFDGSLTCTELADKSVKLGTGKGTTSYISSRLVDPFDIFTSKNGKFVAKYNIGKAAKSDKLIGVMGKVFRGGGITIAGLGLGLAAYGAYKLYKSKYANKILSGKDAKKAFKSGIKGRWVTIKGRKVFLRGK